MKNLIPLALLFAPTSLVAQDTEYMMYGGTPGTAEWEVRRTVDTNFDGQYTGADEGWQFAYDGATQITYVESMMYREINGVPALYAIADGDVIIKMVDLDGDGLATGPGEVVTFIDTRAAHGVTNTSPDDLDFSDVTGELFVTNDLWANGPQAGSGISGYLDLNGDGDAMDAGEMVQLVDALGTITLQEPAGPVDIDIGDFESIMVDSAGVVISFAQQDLALYAFQDQNGDGDAMDAGEAWNFCNLVGDKVNLELNADVAAGVLYSPSCPSNQSSGLYATLEILDVDHNADASGKDIYWIVSTASANSCAGANGLIYRGVDVNGDQDLNDAGEVVLWFNGPNNGIMDYPPSTFYGASAHDGGIAFWSNAGPMGSGGTYVQNSIAYLEDLNGDGDAMDNLEQTDRFYWAPDGCYAKTMTSVPSGAFHSPDGPQFTIFGNAGTTSGGTQPQIGNNTLPYVGQTFEITLTDALPNNFVMLFAGWSNVNSTYGPLPLDLTSLGAPGNTLYASVDFKAQFITDANGAAMLPIGLPPNPTLDGRHLYFQWYVDDPTANLRGLTLSNAGDALMR
ncbi:MAG: hypothetical protein OTJ44_00400 [Planctomycetota bacterium]|nr:hypothetical protein [Planctomycetota bacterium]